MILMIHSCEHKKAIVTRCMRVKSHIYSLWLSFRTLKQPVEMPGNLISAPPVSVEQKKRYKINNSILHSLFITLRMSKSQGILNNSGF